MDALRLGRGGSPRRARRPPWPRAMGRPRRRYLRRQRQRGRAVGVRLLCLARPHGAPLEGRSAGAAHGPGCLPAALPAHARALGARALAQLAVVPWPPPDPRVDGRRLLSQLAPARLRGAAAGARAAVRRCACCVSARMCTMAERASERAARARAFVSGAMDLEAQTARLHLQSVLSRLSPDQCRPSPFGNRHLLLVDVSDRLARVGARAERQLCTCAHPTDEGGVASGDHRTQSSRARCDPSPTGRHNKAVGGHGRRVHHAECGINAREPSGACAARQGRLSRQ
mmetsp:Transcript_31912/g.78763  ORF Transcript_31912/g.78763 Transcript_31912/m.78763 type:complete len:285 (+) Transcript_31912:880-1734(+)